MGGPSAVSGASKGAYAELLDPNRKWYSNRRIIVLNAWIVLMLITSSTNGYDGSMMNGLQSVKNWREYFNNPTGGRLGLFNAIQNIGALAGYPISPYVTDGIGRRGAIFVGATIMCIATAVQTATQSFGMFIAARFLIGFGLVYAANAAPLLVSELSYPSYRAPLTSAYNSLWYSGAIIAAWATYGTFQIKNTWSWRVPSLLQGVPSFLQVALIWFAPESPRWLVAKGKDEKALHTLAYYHADGNRNDPLVQYEIEEIKASVELDRQISQTFGWKTLVSTKGNRKRMVVIIAIAFFSQWSGNGLVSYYLNRVFDAIGITSNTTQLLINGLLQIWNLAWALLASFMCERFGRRFLFLTSVVGMSLFWMMQTVCFSIVSNSDGGNQTAARAVIAGIFLYYAAYDLAFTPLIITYAVEILPTNIRAKGFTVFNFTISIALIFNQYVNPIALEKIGWKYYLVYMCWLIFEGVFLYFTVIETKDLTLEETAALFDGEEVSKQISGKGHAGIGDAGATDDRSDEKEKV